MRLLLRATPPRSSTSRRVRRALAGTIRRQSVSLPWEHKHIFWAAFVHLYLRRRTRALGGSAHAYQGLLPPSATLLVARCTRCPTRRCGVATPGIAEGQDWEVDKRQSIFFLLSFVYTPNRASLDAPGPLLQPRWVALHVARLRV